MENERFLPLIELTLRIHNMEPDDTALYGLWQWGKK